MIKPTTRRTSLYLSVLYLVLYIAAFAGLILLVKYEFIIASVMMSIISAIFLYMLLDNLCFCDDSNFLHHFSTEDKTRNIVKWMDAIGDKYYTCSDPVYNPSYFSVLCIPNKKPRSLYWSVLDYSSVVQEYLDNVVLVNSDDTSTQRLINEFEIQIMLSYEKIVSLFNDPGIKNVLAKNEAAYLFDDVTKTLKKTIEQDIENLYPSVRRISDSRNEFDRAKLKALKEKEILEMKISEDRKRATQEERDQETGIHVLQVLNKINEQEF